MRFWRRLFGPSDPKPTADQAACRAEELVAHYRHQKTETAGKYGLTIEEYDAAVAEDDDDDLLDEDADLGGDDAPSQWHRLTFDLPHPPGADWITYKAWMNVAGVAHRKDAAMQFIKSAPLHSASGDLGLLLERDPTNPYDVNAIKVMGWTGSLPASHLGFVPSHIAEELAAHPLDMPIAANPKKIGISESGGIFVEFALLIPSAKQRKAEGWNPS